MSSHNNDGFVGQVTKLSENNTTSSNPHDIKTPELPNITKARMWRMNTQNLLTSSGEIHSRDPFLVSNTDESEYINVVGEDLEKQDSFEVTKYVWSDVENDSPDKMMNTTLKGVLRAAVEKVVDRDVELNDTWGSFSRGDESFLRNNAEAYRSATIVEVNQIKQGTSVTDLKDLVSNKIKTKSNRMPSQLYNRVQNIYTRTNLVAGGGVLTSSSDGKSIFSPGSLPAMGKDLCPSCYKNEKSVTEKLCEQCLADPNELSTHMKRHQKLMKEAADKLEWKKQICKGCQKTNQNCTCSSICESCGIKCNGKLCNECQTALAEVNLDLQNIQDIPDEQTNEVPIPNMEPILRKREDEIRRSGHGLRTPDGKIISRFPPIKDPELLHYVNGHASDKVNELLSRGCHGYPVTKGFTCNCPFCASRHKRRTLKHKVEGLERRKFKPGEAYTLDFTAMLEEASVEGNRVGVVFREVMTGTPLGQPLVDHTHICEALDWLYYYVISELDGNVRLKFLYGDCDPLWYSSDTLKSLLRRVGRWCFLRGVSLFTNSPGISKQNGLVEQCMSEVMSLTSIQLQCSFLTVKFWDRSFCLAIFIIARRPSPGSKCPLVLESFHKIPWSCLTGRIFDFSVLIAAFGQTVIIKLKGVKANQYKRMGHLGLFMGIPHNAKGWVVYDCVTQSFVNRYDIHVLKDRFLKPAMLMKTCNGNTDLMAPLHPAIPDSDLFQRHISSLLQTLPTGTTFNDYVIKFDTVSGTPKKLFVFQDIDSNELSCFSTSDVPDKITGSDEDVEDDASSEEKRGDEHGNTAENNDGDVVGTVVGSDVGDDDQTDEDGLVVKDHKAAEPGVVRLDTDDAALKLLEEDDGKSISIPSATVVDGHPVRLKTSELRWFKSLYADSKLDTKIRFQALNPKKEGSESRTRYERYKSATTVRRFKELGGTPGDLRWAFCRGQVIIDGTQAVNLIKRAPQVLRKLLIPSTTATVARIIAHETGRQDSGLNRVLRSKISVITSPDAESQEGLKINSIKNNMPKCTGNENISNKNNTPKCTGGNIKNKKYADLEEEIREKLGLSMENMRLDMDNDLAGKADTEDVEVMKGLGITEHQPVWSSISSRELVARATAKVCQVLQDIENTIRTKEGRPVRTSIEEVRRAALDCLLDPDNEDCFSHSDKFKELFHRINAVSVPLKHALEHLDDGWDKPMQDEWKRIFHEMPSIEPIEDDELPEGAVTVPLLWVLVQKQSATGEDTRKKARIVASETLEKHFYERDLKISPIVNSDAVKLMAAMAIEYGCTMETNDVAGGYLHAEYPKDLPPVYVTLPPKLREILKDRPELLPRTKSGKVSRYFV